jgi:pimeloyl-ACP methyl ester carboxylesterase
LNGAKLLYNDLPADEAQLWESRLIPQSYEVQKTKLTQAPWMHVPSTYLVCENDQVLPMQYQEGFAAVAGSELERCNAGHSPMLNQTNMLVERIIAALEKAVGGDAEA